MRIGGLGLIQIASVLAMPHLMTGDLVEVLPDWKPATMPISIIFPQSRHQSPVLRAFIDWLSALCLDHPLLRPCNKECLHAVAAGEVGDFR